MAISDPKYLEATARATFAEKHWRKHPQLNGSQVMKAVKAKFDLGISFATMKKIQTKLQSELPPTVDSVLADVKKTRRKTAQDAVNEMAADLAEEQKALKDYFGHVPEVPVTEAGTTLNIRQRVLELQGMINNSNEIISVHIAQGQKALVTFTHTIEV